MSPIPPEIAAALLVGAAIGCTITAWALTFGAARRREAELKRMREMLDAVRRNQREVRR